MARAADLIPQRVIYSEPIGTHPNVMRDLSQDLESDFTSPHTTSKSNHPYVSSGVVSPLLGTTPAWKQTVGVLRSTCDPLYRSFRFATVGSNKSNVSFTLSDHVRRQRERHSI